MRRALVTLLLVACTRTSGTEGRAPVIEGSGATLPYPLYAKWSGAFSRVDPNARVNYQPLGSGAGIRQISDGVVDFGATDEPLSDEQLRRTPVDLVHVPMTIGAVVIAYTLPGVTELKLAPDVIADVFRGAIVRWDDARLRRDNPGLPGEAITVVHRADGSGTSATFAAYLGRNSEAWRASVGRGTSARFPTGVGTRGNEGVASYVKSTPHALGYVELAYARQAGLPTALVKNRAGAWMAPTLAALDRAAESSLARLPPDLRLSIVDAEHEGAYPIAALSFIVLPRNAKQWAKGDMLGRFVWWALHEGQKLAPALGYAALPPALVARAEETLRGLRAEGRPLSLATAPPARVD